MTMSLNQKETHISFANRVSNLSTLPGIMGQNLETCGRMPQSPESITNLILGPTIL